MPDDSILKIEVKGLDKVMSKLDKFPKEIQSHIAQAGKEAAERVLLKTQGLKKYPPATAANQPPAPYYVRGRGMQYVKRNNMSSERLGTRWTVESKNLQTKIGNSASYAKWVHGDDTQAKAMEKIGWKKLFATAKLKVGDITKVYQAWINKLIKDLGL